MPDLLNRDNGLTLPDWCQLGSRLIIVDGRNPNLVHDGNSANDRALGIPQQSTLSVTLVSGTVLTAQKNYTYGVRRMLRAGLLEVPSAAVTQVITTGTTEAGLLKASIPISPCETLPPAGANWTISYQILRSQPDVTDAIYLVAEITEEERDALEAGAYIDNLPDASLPDVAIENQDTDWTANLQLPPVRYIRAYKGCLIAGGSVVNPATVSTEAESTTITVTTGMVLAADVGAYLQISDEPKIFLITAADPETGTWTVDKAATLTATAAGAKLFRDFDTAHASNPIPGNIEGFPDGESLTSNSGGADNLTGIAVCGGICYLHRRKTVEILDGSSTSWTLTPHPLGFPGTVSHATISDRRSPYMLYYAGRAGVIAMSGTSAQLVSSPIRDILENDVDHAMDGFTHALYDPSTGWYWLWLFQKGWSESGLRIPQLCLIYDTRRDSWHPCELAASRADLWRAEDGSLIPVAGIAGGVVVLHAGASDGKAYAGTVESVFTDEGAAAGITLTGLTDDAGATVAALPTTLGGLAGQPIHIILGDGTILRRIIQYNTASAIGVYGTLPATVVQGLAVRVGSIRYHADFGEIGMDEFDRRKLFEALTLTGSRDAVTNITNLEVLPTRGTQNNKDPLPQGTLVQLDWNQADWHIFDGDRMGARANGAHIRISGDTPRPVTVSAMRLLLENAKR